MSSIPLTGTAFIRFQPVEGVTKVFMECDFSDYQTKLGDLRESAVFNSPFFSMVP